MSTEGGSTVSPGPVMYSPACPRGACLLKGRILTGAAPPSGWVPLAVCSFAGARPSRAEMTRQAGQAAAAHADGPAAPAGRGQGRGRAGAAAEGQVWGHEAQEAPDPKGMCPGPSCPVRHACQAAAHPPCPPMQQPTPAQPCPSHQLLNHQHVQEKKVFDSADWQLGLQGKQQSEPVPGTPLAPRLAPKLAGQSYRRSSHLGDDE